MLTLNRISPSAYLQNIITKIKHVEKEEYTFNNKANCKWHYLYNYYFTNLSKTRRTKYTICNKPIRYYIIELSVCQNSMQIYSNTICNVNLYASCTC